jgi:hypothetical protein
MIRTVIMLSETPRKYKNLIDLLQESSARSRKKTPIFAMTFYYLCHI